MFLNSVYLKLFTVKGADFLLVICTIKVCPVIRYDNPYPSSAT
jgi:hypothetical protein